MGAPRHLLVPGAQGRRPRQEGYLLQLPVRHQAWRRGQADRPLRQGHAHPREDPQRRPYHGRHRHRHRAVPFVHPPSVRREDALPREQKNKAGGKMYIQDKVGEYADEVFTRMDNGGHMYFCGLKGMMPGILEMLDGVSKEKGIVWEDKLKEWKKNGQWHVEVY